MNIKDNKRHQETLQQIYTAFASMLREKELQEISVTDLCEAVDIERSTFYANHGDISGLANTYATQIEKQVATQPHEEGEFAWIFEYILANKELFRGYFKLGVGHASADYKTIFFRNGVYSVAKLWFEDGCIESPQKMGEIIQREYKKLFD
jgi:AcrR family transcriptional regulator